MSTSPDRRTLLLACAAGAALAGSGCAPAPTSTAEIERYIGERSNECAVRPDTAP